MKKSICLWARALGLLALTFPNAVAAATSNYLLESPTPAQAQAACQRYGFTVVKTIRQPDLYLVSRQGAVPLWQLKKWVKDDPDVKNLEEDDEAGVPEDSLKSNPPASPSAATSAMNNKGNSPLAGGSAWTGYVNQPSVTLINATGQKLTGAGIVAIIDTGVDPHHPVLMSSLLAGFDFTRGIPGPASELADLNQSTSAILDQHNTLVLHQSTSAILDGDQVVQLNQSTSAILDQTSWTALQSQPLPADFGHGTMVAGLVHLVAPTAKIMPLKAFNADGSAKTSDIVAAIYYATDHGANVINMSFSMPAFSDELMRAVNYATRNGVICVASAGNEGQQGLLYPAALNNVVSIGSTTMNDQRSSFSNYGADLVTIGAPGEALITTYPGGHYAAVWGTSFSSALVSGGASLLENTFGINSNPSLQVGDVKRAFAQAALCSGCNLGYGRVDLSAAMQYASKLGLPPMQLNRPPE